MLLEHILTNSILRQLYSELRNLFRLNQNVLDGGMCYILYVWNAICKEHDFEMSAVGWYKYHDM
jgi:hypothetical protein